MRVRGLRTLATNLLGALIIGSSSVACADLQLLESDTCGNFVIDEGEDCDGHPIEAGTVCVGPDKPNACRQICDDTTSCPTGWGCGYDGICRQPSGSYEQIGTTVPFATPNQMVAGDFDEDGATDLLLLGHENAIGLRPARIAYSQSGFTPASVYTLDLDMASPVLGELDEDGELLDVAFASPAGISVLRGSRNRTAEFAVFPYFNAPNNAPMRVIPIDVFSEVPGDELMVLVEESANQTAVRTQQDNLSEWLLDLPFGLDALSGEVQRGRFDEAAPCDQLVFAARGANNVLVYCPCRTDGTSGWNTPAVPTTLSLPMGITVDKGVLVGDFDMNGHVDILIETNGPAQIAWGLGTGMFQSELTGGTANGAGPFNLPKAGPPEFPLAAADLNGDSNIDFVFPHSLLVSQGTTYFPAYENFGAPWSSAVIADFNANGSGDVIACSSESIDCTFLNNAGNGIFNPSTIATDAPVGFLTAADFDGDLVNDIALVEIYPESEFFGDNRLAVGYGRTQGAPEQVTTVGRLEDTAQIATTFVRDPGGGINTLDGIADLIVVDGHQVTVDGMTTLVRHAVLFRGSGSRVLQTSRPLVSDTENALPLALTVARFAGEKPEITALGADRATGNLRFWTIEGAEADLARPGPLLPDGFHSGTKMEEISFRYGAYLAAGDLNRDGDDELVMIGPYGSAADGVALVIADYNDDDDTFVPRSPQPISAAISVDNHLSLRDVDGDGFLDAILTTGTHENPGDLIVIWGDGQGGLDTTVADHFRPLGGVGGCVCLPKKNGCQLLLATPSGVYLASSMGSRNLELTKIEELPAATTIALGDFDRDGVVDIALHTVDGLSYFQAVPVNP